MNDRILIFCRKKHLFYANIRIKTRMLRGLYNEEVDDFEMVKYEKEILMN